MVGTRQQFTKPVIVIFDNAAKEIASSQRASNFTIANVAIVVSYTLASLGYFLGLQKSILVHAGPFSWFYVALPFAGFHPSAV